jgi:HSP20 family protein
MADLLHQTAADLAEDARQLLKELEREIPGVAGINPECRPPLDVLERAAAVEVVVDVPGVLRESLRVVIRRSTLLVVGVKPPGPAQSDVRFHLAERAYGRFARAVRINGTFDAARIRATTSAGQLRVVLPRIEDRRGRMYVVPVDPE